jgi:hypothetical protein
MAPSYSAPAFKAPAFLILGWATKWFSFRLNAKSKAKFKLEIKIIKTVAHKMMNSLSCQQQRIGSGEGINILKIYNLKGKSQCEHYWLK